MFKVITENNLGKNGKQNKNPHISHNINKKINKQNYKIKLLSIVCQNLILRWVPFLQSLVSYFNPFNDKTHSGSNKVKTMNIILKGHSGEKKKVNTIVKYRLPPPPTPNATKRSMNNMLNVYH